MAEPKKKITPTLISTTTTGSISHPVTLKQTAPSHKGMTCEEKIAIAKKLVGDLEHVLKGQTISTHSHSEPSLSSGSGGTKGQQTYNAAVAHIYKKYQPEGWNAEKEKKFFETGHLDEEPEAPAKKVKKTNKAQAQTTTTGGDIVEQKTVTVRKKQVVVFRTVNGSLYYNNGTKKVYVTNKPLYIKAFYG